MRLGVIAFLAGLLLGASPASAITYNLVNQGGGIPLSGYIITDGTLGTLSQANILDWQITETGTSGPGITTSINASTSVLSLVGSALSATSSSLLFNFASTAASVLSFTSLQSYYVSVVKTNEPAFQLTYCDTGAACMSPFNVGYKVQLILTTTSGASFADRPSGTSPIAAVPVPAGLTLLLSGLAGLATLGGLSLRRPGAGGQHSPLDRRAPREVIAAAA